MQIGPAASLYWAGMGGLRINEHVTVPEEDLIPLGIAMAAAKHHPRQVQYRAPAIYRSIAHGLAHPDCVVAGFGALALYGLPVLADACDTVLINPKAARKTPGTATKPAFVRGDARPENTWRVFLGDRCISAARPGIAAVQALKSIRRKEVAWQVETVGDDEVFIRAVQLVDAVRRFLGIAPASIVAAGHQLVDDRWLARVVAASSAKADSPKETEMRLILRRVAKTYGLTLADQVPCRLDGRIITTLDFALLEPRYGYMFDGVHHWGKAQRVKDARINIELALIGVTPLRFSTGLLGTLPATTEALLRRDGFL